MRRSERLRYFPCRLSLVPDLLSDMLPPDVVLVHTSTPVPYTQGDAVLPADDIDYAIEVDEPLPSPQPRPASDVFCSIGERVAALVPAGATLQLGIGGVPGIRGSGCCVPRRPTIRASSPGTRE
jgi:hypothetical protein